MPELRLPVTDDATLGRCYADVALHSREGGVALADAQLRLAWALAHSRRDADVERAGELVDLLLEASPTSRELLYLRAVCAWQQHDFAEARRRADATLASWPGCGQAQQLRAASETQLAEDALAGLAGGAVAVAAVAVVALLLGSVASSSRDRKR